MENLTGNQYLTVKEAAALLRISPQTLYGRLNRREIGYTKSGGKVLIRREDIEKSLKVYAPRGRG